MRRPKVKTPRQQPEDDSKLLEINLISAQNLKPPPSSYFRQLQTYAVVYLDSKAKLRSRVDPIGDKNPTWNDKFIFRVSKDFLSRETSAVTVDIFAVGAVTDVLLGSVRVLLYRLISPASYLGVPSFDAFQVRRPSGKYRGVLNVGAALLDVGNRSFFSGVPAIGFEQMMGLGQRKSRERRRRRVVIMGVGRLFRALPILRARRPTFLRRVFRGFRLKKGGCLRF